MPLLDLFWAMLMFFVLVALIWVVISVIVDIFRSDDLSGWRKALWVLLVIVLPFLGVLLYLGTRGANMHARAVADATARDAATERYIQTVTSTSAADEVAKLEQLHNDGTIDDAEFARLKERALQG